MMQNASVALDISPPAGAPSGGDGSAGGLGRPLGPPAPAGFAGLKAQRAALRAESARLGIAAQRMEAANEAQRAAVKACDALVANDSAATLAWARNGSLGDPPAPDRAEHDKLAAALARAATSAAAAKGACAGIGQRLAELTADMAAIDAQIAAVALDALTAEHVQAVAMANRAVASAATLIGEAHGRRISDFGGPALLV